MKKAALLIFLVSMAAIGIGSYGHQRSLDEENFRLREVVEIEFPKLQLPSAVNMLYEEVSADRVCKTASITRLFSTDRSPADICDSFHSSLNANRWNAYDVCRTTIYPLERAPIDGDKPEYHSVRLVAGLGSRPHNFLIQMDVKPHSAWGHLFMLSTFGEQEAIPLAKRSGKTFFTIKLSYHEDHRLFDQLCPEQSDHCECDQTLFSYEFADGRQYSRSN